MLIIETVAVVIVLSVFVVPRALKAPVGEFFALRVAYHVKIEHIGQRQGRLLIRTAQVAGFLKLFVQQLEMRD